MLGKYFKNNAFYQRKPVQMLRGIPTKSQTRNVWDFRRGETTTEAILRSEASSKLRLKALKPENQTKPAQTRARLRSLNFPAKADPQAAHFIKSLSWFRTATNA